VLSTMADNSVDSIVTDPPYGLSFMGKKWDYDVPSVEIWREWARALESQFTQRNWDGSCTETKYYFCFCGHRWKFTTEFNCDGLKVAERRYDYKEKETK